MGEQAAVDLQARPEASHDAHDASTILQPHLLGRIGAQPEFMVAPHPDCARLVEQRNRLAQTLAKLKDIAQDDNLINALLREDRQRPAQIFDVLMNVRQDPELHRPRAPWIMPFQDQGIAVEVPALGMISHILHRLSSAR